MLSKSLKTLLGFGLLGFVGVWIGCSGSSPVAPSAGKSLTDDSTPSADSHFTDSNLEAAVRTALGFPTTRPISVIDIASLTKLEANNKNIRSLAGLEHAWGLDTLSLRSNTISDLSPLARLIDLKYLNLHSNKITDVSSLAGLTNLKSLWLDQNKISDLSPLASLTNLENLRLRVNKTFTDVSPLASLTNLKWLNLNNTNFSDLRPLTCLPNLQTLYLVKTPHLSEESVDIYIPFLRANGVGLVLSHGLSCSPGCRTAE